MMHRPAPDPDLDDGPALLAAACGDRRAFDQVVDRHKGLVFACVRRRVRDAHAAEDLTQETVLHAFRAVRAGAFTGQAKLTTWLLTIANNCLIDHLRAAARRTAASPADPRPSAALATLPAEQRQVVEMKLDNGEPAAADKELARIGLPGRLPIRCLTWTSGSTSRRSAGNLTRERRRSDTGRGLTSCGGTCVMHWYTGEFRGTRARIVVWSGLPPTERACELASDC